MEKEEVQKVDTQVKEKHTWFERMLNHQSQKKPYELPSVTAAAINSERKSLESLANSVFNKPKPAPPPPPPPPPPPADTTAAGATPAAAAGAQQPGPTGSTTAPPPTAEGAQKTPTQGTATGAQQPPTKPVESMDVD